MKYLLYSGFLIISLLWNGLNAFADLPYMPLEFNLTTTTDAYIEGDKIEFILIIRNTDKLKSYPILVPGSMNAGKKLIYLRVFDPSGNMFLLRAEESREMNMNIKQLGKYEVISLGPEKELKITFNWNDSIHYLTAVASHHSLNKPLFAGNYMFQAFYNPFGTTLGDSLYNLMTSTEDKQSGDKLNFLGAELSQPCLVKIQRNKSSHIVIDGISYCSVSIGEHEQGGLYYLKEDFTTNGPLAKCILELSGSPGQSLVRAEVKHDYFLVGPQNEQSRTSELIFRDENGIILNYSLTNESRCPSNFYLRAYHSTGGEIKLQQKTDSLSDGTLATINYNNDGTVLSIESISKGGFIRKNIQYYYKEGKIIRTRKKVKKSKKPCQISLEPTNR